MKIAVLSNDISTIKTLVKYKSDINYSNPLITYAIYQNNKYINGTFRL
jgi:hypothetical protein